MKIGLLVLLGFLWSARLAAIKAAGLSGVPVHVTVSMSIFGIALLFTAFALRHRSWPPVDRSAISFYLLSGAFGFILPFILENIVAPNLPVFVFVVVISTMPIITLGLAVALKAERPSLSQYVAIGLGFIVALLIAGETAHGLVAQGPSWKWIALAFGVPVLYAGNTLFVASRWPKSVGATHVAHAQAIIISLTAIAGSVATGAIDDWPLASRNVAAIAGIAVFEGLALLVYLRITRDFGATFVSLANYISMVFAAILGAVLFGDRLTWLSVGAAFVLIASLTLNQFERRR